MSLLRIWVIARHVFLGIIRDRALYLIALYSLLMLAATILLPQVASVAYDKIILDVGITGIHLLSLLVVAFIGTGLINQEIEKRTVLTMIAKPVSPMEFIAGKHLGLSLLLALLIGLMGGVYVGVLWLNGIAYSPMSLLLATVFMLLEMVLLGAIALLLGVITSSLLATLLTFAVYLMGHLSSDIVTLGQLSENSSLRLFTRGLYLILPDLERLNLRNQAIYGWDWLPSTEALWSHGGYAIVYTLVLLALTGVIFSRRQF
ncbi:MAG: ABC transporter permease subunit [Cyanobacteria bacterium]|nr:ABC transporter permease subunit [Cyanobacteriota bacterium]MDA0867025.1 ABC transporter permease subunit [Cyanobacteriota bacterium]